MNFPIETSRRLHNSSNHYFWLFIIQYIHLTTFDSGFMIQMKQLSRLLWWFKSYTIVIANISVTSFTSSGCVCKAFCVPLSIDIDSILEQEISLEKSSPMGSSSLIGNIGLCNEMWNSLGCWGWTRDLFLFLQEWYFFSSLSLLTVLLLYEP